MKYQFPVIIICFSFLFLSCSGDDNAAAVNPSSGNNNDINSITISTVVQTFNNTSPVAFIVKDNLNNSVTNQSIITANGAEISNPHLFTEPGVYQISATFQDFTSNTLELNIEDNPPTSIILSFNQSDYIIGDEGVFVVKDNFNNIITEESEVTVNGEIVTTNPFSFDQGAVYEFIATYQGLISNTITIEIFDPSDYSDTTSFISTGSPSNFTKKVLLEDFTGTWCPQCPPAAAAVANAVNSNANIFGVGYHYNDPMQIPETAFWTNHYNVTGFPTVYVNGPDTRWNYSSMSQVNNELSEEATLGLSVEAEIVGGKLDLELNIGFKSSPVEEVKLMIYLIESTATSSSPQSGSSLGTNYVHNDILREVYTDQLGDVIPPSNTLSGGIYTRTMTGLDIPENTTDFNDLKVVVFVRNTYTKTFVDYFNQTHENSPHYDIYNVQEVHVGETASFD
ncbi:MAG: hypothetical protein CMC86_01630 [Flavobacteriaceae bacterium]|nr:hypothetical protein [Flavobacteriaceae bacterium]|tara:strand:+ start:24811 stop:26166 length:1356 start_codon:yes stop_codon:yes gene_type:complete